MTGFDYAVFLIVALAAIAGFIRGFVEEVLALAAWCLAMLAVHYFHAGLTVMLIPYINNVTGAGVVAFGILLAIPYFATKLLARQMGSASRGSMLGPIDRVLGFGFGAIKGFVVIVLVFSLVMFSFDVVWGAKGRPAWIRTGRTYPFLNAASNELMTLIAARRTAAQDDASARALDDGNDAQGDTAEPPPVVHHPHRHRHPVSPDP